MTVPAVRVLGLVQNDPLRGPVALRTLDAIVRLADDVDGAGVGTVVDGASLVSRTRLAGPVGLGAAVGAPRGRATVVQFGSARELRPTGLDPAANLGPYRARSWAGAVVGGVHDADTAAASRERLLATLPDFLRRLVAGRSEGEAFFLAVLARVHGLGSLDAIHDNAGVVLDAVRAVDAAAAAEGAVAPRQVTITNGVEVVHVARGLPSAVVDVAGLADDVAGALDPTLADSSTARERNRRYRAVVTLGALDALMPVAAPRGCSVQSVDGDAAVIVGRDLTVRRL
jgi:hypothetical protein